MMTRRARKWISWGITIFVTAIVLGLLVVTWYYSEQIEDGLLAVESSEPDYDLEVVSVTPGFVVLPRTEDTERAGRYGLRWEDGYAQIGDVITRDSRIVARKLLDVDGTLEAGDMVEMDSFAFAEDPGDVGLEFEEVVIEGPLEGGYPAWEITGEDDTWVVFVHGKGSSRREALRMLPTVSEMGFPCLVITYRNDEGAPSAGRHRVGETEWEDVEAAVEYALLGGAEDVVLVGYSMGGVVSSMFLHESAWTGRVRGAIFDAPLLKAGAAVDAEAAEMNVPGFVTGWAKALATLRFGIDWGRIDQVERADEFDLPILLIHGDDDDRAPFSVSEAFAAARPDLVTFEPFQGAGHVQAWNVDPARYESIVVDFLTEHALGASELEGVDPDAEEFGS